MTFYSYMKKFYDGKDCPEGDFVADTKRYIKQGNKPPTSSYWVAWYKFMPYSASWEARETLKELWKEYVHFLDHEKHMQYVEQTIADCPKCGRTYTKFDLDWNHGRREAMTSLKKDSIDCMNCEFAYPGVLEIWN